MRCRATGLLLLITSATFGATIVEGERAGMRLQILEGVEARGVVVVDRSGAANFNVEGLAPGAHTLRAVEWGTGRRVAGPVKVMAPAERSNGFGTARIMATGIRPAMGAAADLNGDGFADLLFAGEGGVSWMRNHDGAFASPEKLVDRSEPTAILARDFNGDGLNDVAVTVADGRVAILLNLGGGKFSPAQYFPAGRRPAAITAADFNGDGIPDLAIANADGNDVSILLGNGDGTFQGAIAVAAGASPRALVAGDFNGDGIADLAVANFDGNDVTILMGDGKGGFRASRVAVGNGPATLLVADLNEDGLPDLAVLNEFDGSVSLLMNKGAAGFEAAVSTLSASSFAVGDVDGDGHIDLVLQSEGVIHVRRGRGDGSFDAGYVTKGSLSPFALADFSHSGRLDFAGLDNDGPLTVLPGATLSEEEIVRLEKAVRESSVEKVFPPRRLRPLGVTPSGLALSSSANPSVFGRAVTLTATVTPSTATGKVTFYDRATVLGTSRIVSGQAVLTTILLASGSRSLRAFYTGDATYTTATSTLPQTVSTVAGSGFTASTITTATGPDVVVVADFNGDGKADIAVLADTDSTLSIYFGNGAGGFQPPVDTVNVPAGGFMAAGDFNGDGKTDLVVGTSVFLGNGDGTFQPPVTYTPVGPVGGPMNGVVVADFNGDGNADLAFVYAQGRVAVLLGNGDGTFQTPKVQVMGGAFSGIVMADFNGDGNADLAIPSYSAPIVYVLLGKGDGTFQTPVSYPAPNYITAVSVGDFNGDGKADLVAALGFVNINNDLSGSGVAVFLGNGNGTFQAAASYNEPGGPVASVVGDFNGDGRDDAAMVNASGNTPANNVSVLLTLPNGALQAPMNYPTGLNPRAIAVGDFNGDGRADLVVTNNINFGDGTTMTVLLAKAIGAPVTPSVFIEAPAAGATISGTVTVSGWAINNISAVGAAIGSVQVKVDGTVVGNATYGSSRPDVCGPYPGRPNCPNVGFTFSLNTANLGSGAHTITVSATDTAATPNTGSANVAVTVSSTAPTVVIDSPAAGAAISGTVNVSGWAVDNSATVGTAIGSVIVKVDGNTVGTASYGASRQDVCNVYTGRPGCPNVGYSFSLNTASLSSGSHTITVTAIDSDLTPDSASASVTVSVAGAPPLVVIDAPASGMTVGGIFTVSGWALDNTSAIGAVQVKVDGTVVGSATYGSSRPDVCAVYTGRPGCPNVGYSFALNTATLAAGAHTLTVTATDSDVSADSATAAVSFKAIGPPTVDIDSPAAGSTVTGTVTVSGWAIDNASSIGSGVGTVQVKVDGAVVGNATYGGSRPDVCNVLPGRPNCPNVGYSFALNTAGLAAGTHTITVSATGTDGASDIGSTTVTVMVAGQAPSVVIDVPAAGTTVPGSFTLSGWALDSTSAIGTAISNVQVRVDGNVVGNATYGIARPDVCNVFAGRPGCPNVGYSFPLTGLTAGQHTISVLATNSNATPVTGSASTTVTVFIGPTVFIDAPAGGSTVSGTVTMFGWALDNSSSIGTAIGSVQVKVDGNVVGNATYGSARADVCNAFPGRPGCPNVGWSFLLNTSALAPGAHTITVLATNTNATPVTGMASTTVNIANGPTVFIDAPVSGATVSGTVTVAGWAIDNAAVIGTAIAAVQVKVDGNVVGNATYGVARQDVCNAFPGRPGCPNVGYTFQLNTATLTAGSHTLTVTATDSDGTPDSSSASITIVR